MSSLARRLQIRIMKRKYIKPILVVSDAGKALGSRFPLLPNQLLFIGTTPVFAGDTHPTLQPIIDILSEDAARRKAA